MHFWKVKRTVERKKFFAVDISLKVAHHSNSVVAIIDPNLSVNNCNGQNIKIYSPCTVNGDELSSLGGRLMYTAVQ